MNERETIELYEATDGTGAGLRGVFILGSLCDRNEQIAVSRQQVRAINLVYSLVNQSRLPRTGQLCVVGAGAAGLTAAALAVTLGIQVTVLECREPLWNLRGCRTRWLHPNLFSLWPNEGWDLAATEFPVMNWYADYADRVGEHLWAKYRSYIPAGSRPWHPVDGQSLELQPRGDRWEVTWRPPRETTSTTGCFDAVIFAVGFGTEAKMRDAAASVYWVDDALERPDPYHGVMRYLVSGAGDGGLTDLLRLRFANFRHHHLRELLQDLPPALVNDARELEHSEAEAYRRSNDRQRASADERLTRGLMEAFKRHPAPAMLRALRHDTEVLLASREPVALSPGRAWPVSRFLAAALLSNDPYTTYHSTGPAGIKLSAIAPYDGRAPTGFHVQVGGVVKVVDAVVFRHGTEEIVRGLLRRAGVTELTLAAIEEKWRDRWAQSGTTSQPVGTWERNKDNGQRAKAWSVRPALAGRTLIGMLSRLIAQIDPDMPVPSMANVAPLSRRLVTDGVAALVTPREARRLPVHSETGWRLPGKLCYEDVVRAIQTIDVSLGCLDDPEMCRAHLEELEHHWVLPRCEWLPPAPPGALLLNTCVAQCWGRRRLRYRREPGRLSDVGLLPLPTDPEEFRVLDLEGGDVPARVVLVSQASPSDDRLARQLLASCIRDSSELRSL